MTSWIEAACDELKDTLAGKNEDYRIDSEFSNFEYAAGFAGLAAQDVMLCQIGIKIGRLMGLTKEGDTYNNESYKDTVKDLAGYLLILYGHLLASEAPSPFDPPKLVKYMDDQEHWRNMAKGRWEGLASG